MMMQFSVAPALFLFGKEAGAREKQEENEDGMKVR